jgi:hypothetical protein
MIGSEPALTICRDCSARHVKRKRLVYALNGFK